VSRLAPAVAQAIREDCLPAPVCIKYSPNHPARCWLADLGWREFAGETPFSLFAFSLAVLPIQVFVGGMFLWALTGARKSTAALPWWYDLHGVVLLAAAASVALLLGGFLLLCEGITDLVC
jgi:hypothetical protein